MADPLGVSIAFGNTPLAADPTWTRLDTHTGLRIQEWTIDRGRPNEFAKTGTGTAVIRGVDLDGVLDPTNTGGPFFGDIQPNKQAAIALRDPVLNTWHTVFRGFVDEFTFDLHRSKAAIFFEIELVDAFGFLAKQELQPGSDGDALPSHVPPGNVWYAATSGPDGVRDRLLAILADVSWPSSRTDIFSGNVTLQEKTYGPGTAALAALSEAVDGEFPGVANHWMSKAGVYTFRGRQPRFRPDVAEYGINERDVGDPTVDADVAQISALSWNRGTSALYNAVLVTPQGIDPADVEDQYATDATSIAAYGRQSLTLEDLLTFEGLATSNTAIEECQLIRGHYLANYKDPHDRVSKLTFRSKGLESPYAAATWRQLCRAEISDLLNLKTTHPGGGGFDDAFFTEGLHYVCRPLDGTLVDVTLDVDVSSAAHYGTNPFDADPDP